MSDIPPKVDANPTKAFFVRMITRDISLDDCILDLIDNSVDGAWRSEGSRPMGLTDGTDLSKYSIEIEALPGRFRITDNCGGMNLDDAVNHAFSFGRGVLDTYDDYSIGVYGIGMKRAVFKLGTEVRIRSTYEEDGRRQSFAVPIAVSTWLNDDKPPWDFDIDQDEPLAENGVEVFVEGLTPVAASAFSSPAFLQNLRRTIARDYSLHLNRGLRISVNDKKVTGWQFELPLGDEFAPMRLEYKDEYKDEKRSYEVSVEIIGGMGAPPPESLEPDESKDDDRRWGWYVICNGRVVLAADKTSVSGWGVDDWPQWHGQYSGFIGIILFTAANAVALPLTTTKRSVDVTSEVYRRARGHMRAVSRQWIDYTNQRKPALDEAKRRESAAVLTPIYQLPRREVAVLPTYAPRAVEKIANVNYSVSLARLKKLAKELGSITMAYRDVGVKSFEYAYEDLVGRE